MDFSRNATIVFLSLLAATVSAQEDVASVTSTPIPSLSDSSTDFGVSVDILAAKTSSELRLPEPDAVRARSLQLHFLNERDWGEFRATADMSDGSYGAEFSLREANVWLMNLPGRSALRVGRFLPTLGAWNDILPSGAPWPSSDGVRRAYWGGNWVADGFEWHQLQKTGSERLHLSVGMAAQGQGHDVDLPGNGYRLGLPDSEGFPAGEQKETIFAHVDLLSPKSRGTLSLGLTGMYSPRAAARLQPETGALIQRDLPRFLIGFDATWNNIDSHGLGHLLTFETWLDKREFLTEVVTEGDMSIGAWAAWNWRFASRASFGLMASAWEIPDQLVVSAATYHSCWVGAHLTPRQELRLFVESRDAGGESERATFVGLQWTFSLGKPRAASAWF